MPLLTISHRSKRKSLRTFIFPYLKSDRSKTRAKKKPGKNKPIPIGMIKSLSNPRNTTIPMRMIKI